MPQLLPGATEEVGLAGLSGEPQRLGVHVGVHQHLAREPVLHHTRHQPALVEFDLGIVHLASILGLIERGLATPMTVTSLTAVATRCLLTVAFCS